MTETAAVKEKKTCSVPPFTIEADHPRNCDLLLQGVTDLRLRSRYLAARPVWDKRKKEWMIPPNQPSIPEIPGMQLSVDPARLRYRITDPLEGQQDQLDAIKRHMDQVRGVETREKLRGVDPIEGTLTTDEMKTLVREILWLVNSKEARVVKGVCPDLQDIEALDGDFLLNPGSRVPNTQPKYEKDWDQYREQLNRSGM